MSAPPTYAIHFASLHQWLGDVRTVIAALGLAFAVYKWLARWLAGRRGGDLDLDAIARRMADVVGEAREDHLGRTKTANLTFKSDDGSHPGTLATIAAYFAELHEPRLVILGPAGAGKTVLALELQHVLAKESPLRMVPVAIDATTWAIDVSLKDALLAQLRETLKADRASCERAMRQQKLLLVLDGLDELDDPQGPPLRARSILRQFNELDFQERVPVLLTCRSELYESLGPAERMAHATAVVVDAMTPALVDAFLDNLPLHDRDAWRPLQAAIDADLSGPLAKTLRRPWWLTMAGHVSSEPHDADAKLPGLAELQYLAEHGMLEDRLLSSYAGLALERVKGRHAARWVRALAVYLETNRRHPRTVGVEQLSPSAVVAHKLWPVGGERSVLAIDTGLSILMSAPGLVWLGWFSWGKGPLAMVLFLAGASVYSYRLLRTSRTPWIPPVRVRLGKQRLGAVVVQTGAAVLLGIVANLLGGPVLGVAAGLAAWVALGLTIGASQSLVYVPDTTPPSPDQPLRDELVVSMLSAAAALPLCVVALQPSVGWAWAAPIASAYCLLVGVTVASAVWRRYLALLLATRGRLPWRLRRFLRKAHGAGLLRRAGVSYQFRHRELQEHLGRCATAGPPVMPPDPAAPARSPPQEPEPIG